MTKQYRLFVSALIFAAFCAGAEAEEKVTHFGGIKPEPAKTDIELSETETRDLLNALTDSDFNRRMDAQWKLRLFRNKSIAPDLIRLLSDKRPYVRQLSCELLGEIGDRSCLPNITEILLNDSDGHVKETAARVLGVIGNRSVVPALVEAINQPRPIPDTVGYWLFPNDIYDNYRYAAVDALNRITKNNFYLRRNETNFGRISAQNQINKWWKENKVLFTKEIDDLAAMTKKLEEQAAAFKKEASAGGYTQDAAGEDLGRNIDIFSDKAKALNALISALPSKKENIAPALDELREMANYIDEIFVYSSDIADLKGKWENLKELLKEVDKTIREKVISRNK